ncbi:cell wall elongation regulator TseB-like domain-containing protein [Solibacillus sp. FSL H8-0538]|uniref:cell wall elongation regulator TseB-like domain-containing protein n=1 Tax=Solibacillus sp. FSL H8-0538 TaxID=2921400 RepID=UPI0030FC829C
MKNWLIFGAVFILSLSLVISVLVLWKADAPFNDMEQQAEQLALDTKALAVVSESYIYNGNKPYTTVFGVDEYGKEKAIFVPISLEENSMQEVFLQDGITKEQALTVLSNETSVKEILHTKLGFEEAGAVWEITYTNEAEKLNYVYILFEDGQWWKRILNL